ncbi:hypothetical protein O9992_22920 [Vibrio lentus]|nr:hypothetical protein [Vibrio lentus]
MAEDVQFKAVETKLVGTVQQKAISNPRNFYQAGVQYRSMNEQDKSDLIANLAGDLNKVTDKGIKTTIVSYFYHVQTNSMERVWLKQLAPVCHGGKLSQTNN